MNHKKLFLFVLLFISFLAVGFKVEAGTTPIKGWGWSSNIGWISFNSTNTGAGTGSAYNVTFSTTTGSSIGTLGGYAWSPNIGWVSFDRSVANNPPSDDIGSGSGALADVNTSTGQVRGWARALSGCLSDIWDGTKCTATGAGNANGVGILSEAAVTIKSATFAAWPQRREMTSNSCVENSLTHKIYCLGGGGESQEMSDAVSEYNSITDTIVSKAAVFPLKIKYSSCAENSSTHKIYCFGGSEWGGGNVGTNRIFEYDPNTDTLITKNAVLPSTLLNSSCAENSSTHKIYCFGGSTTSAGSWNPVNKIFEYTPATDSIITMNAVLPQSSHLLSCAKNSSTHKIYCFGGLTSSGYVALNSIFEYNPDTDTLVSKTAILPLATHSSSCAENSSTHKIYCFGGYNTNANTNTSSNKITEYNPDSDSIITKIQVLPSPRSRLSCAENSLLHNIYCFEGATGVSVGTDINQVFEYGSTAPNNGADGWIRLSGTNHVSPNTSGYQSTSTAGVTFDPTKGTFSGYAWGSDVIGWLSFASAGPFGQEVTCAPNCGGSVDDSSSMTLEASAGNGWSDEVTIMANSSGNATVQVRWNPVNVDEVALANDWPGTENTGATVYQTKNLSASTVNSPVLVAFTGITQDRVEYLRLTYHNIELDDYDNVEVKINLLKHVPTVSNCSVPANARLCQYSVDAQGVPSTVVGSCVSTMLDPISCEFYCPTGFVKVANTCKRPGTIEER